MANENKATQAEIINDETVASRYLNGNDGQGVMVWYPIDKNPKPCTTKTKPEDRDMPWYGMSQHIIHANLAEKVVISGRLFKPRGMLLEANPEFPHDLFKTASKKQFAERSIQANLGNISSDARSRMRAELDALDAMDNPKVDKYLIKKNN